MCTSWYTVVHRTHVCLAACTKSETENNEVWFPRPIGLVANDTGIFEMHKQSFQVELLYRRRGRVVKGVGHLDHV